MRQEKSKVKTALYCTEEVSLGNHESLEIQGTPGEQLFAMKTRATTEIG